MALISDILRGPYGDPQPNVIITMRAKETSARVLVSNSSAATTAADGKYSMQVFPGEYEVLVSTLGKVGEIRVYPDSKDGTLNDFLITPGEDELTPEIVQTVETMRVEAAKSAAAAKISENNAAATLANAAKNGANSDITSLSGLKTALSISQGGTGAKTSQEAAQGILLGSCYDRFTSGYVSNGAWMKITVKFADTSNGKTIGFIIIGGSLFNGNPLQQGVQFVTIKTGNTNKDGFSNAVIHTLFGANNRTIKEAKLNTLADGLTVELYCRVDQYSSDTGAILLPSRHANISDVSFSNVQVLPANIPATASDARVLFVDAWTNQNTTTDSNGFVKKASPIVKLFRDGASELNNESLGVTTERVSEGVYRVSGTLGFNADAQWGGPDGGIEVPLDRNKQPLIWVDYEVEPTGDLLIKTYHRTHLAAPAFARNDVLGYDEGMPIDIPEGRWVDLRVEMPVVDEPGTEEEATA